LKFLQGWSYAELLDAEGGVTTDQEAVYGSGSLYSVVARGGQGFGADLGFTGSLGRDWVGMAAVRDLFAGITWTQDVEERVDTFDIPGLTMGDGAQDGVISETTTRSLPEVRTDLPVTFSFGTAHWGHRWIHGVQLSWSSARRYGGHPNPRLSVATSWLQSDWLALRGDASLGGEDRAGVGGGLGIGLGPTQLDLEARSWGSLNPFASQGIAGAVSLGINL
jgi:hypothetical protein